MAEAWESPEGDNGASNRPFDRQALHATLADALRDAEMSDDGTEAPAASAPAPAPQPAPPAAPPRPVAPPMPAPPTAAPPMPAPPMPAPPQAAAPQAAPAPPAPAPAPAGPKVNPFGPKPAPPAPVQGAGAAPGPRTGPSILSGGISNAISQMTAPAGSLGGTSINALRPPGALGASGPRPLPSISGLAGGAAAKTADEPTEEATIQLRRPTRPEPEKDAAAPAPAAPAAPVRPSVTVAAWLPTDDDILPGGAMKRKAKAPKAPKGRKGK